MQNQFPLRRYGSPINQLDINPIEVDSNNQISKIETLLQSQDNKDVLVYEVEVKDLKVEERTYNNQLLKRKLILIQPISVYIIFNVSYFMFMISLLFILLSSIGPLYKNKSSASYGQSCISTLECNQTAGFVCDYNTSSCVCASPSGYNSNYKKCVTCPESPWTFINLDCYLNSTLLATNYTFAKQYCESLYPNSQLPIFNNLNEFLVMNQTLCSSNYGVNLRYFMGCSDIDSPGRLKCLDGSLTVNGVWCNPVATIAVGKQCVYLDLRNNTSCLNIANCGSPSVNTYIMCKLTLLAV